MDVSLWHCYSVMETQIALMAAFVLSALLDQVSHLSLDNNLWFLYGVTSGPFVGQ